MDCFSSGQLVSTRLGELQATLTAASMNAKRTFWPRANPATSPELDLRNSLRLQFRFRDDAAPAHCKAMREMVRAGLYNGCTIYRAEPGTPPRPFACTPRVCACAEVPCMG